MGLGRTAPQSWKDRGVLAATAALCAQCIGDFVRRESSRTLTLRTRNEADILLISYG